MNIHVEKKNTAAIAGQALARMFADTDNKPLLMLLSGGSSLALLDFVDSAALGPRVTIGMLDDRYSHDEFVNSFGIIKSTSFYKAAVAKGVIFLDSSVHENESLGAYAERYEDYIQSWMKANPDGIIRATIGIGPDGHTSGILPHPEDPETFQTLFNGDRLIVGYDVGNKNPHRYRMTSTFTLMRKFDRVLTYMTGENKRLALQKVLAEEGSLAETPGRIVQELHNVDIFTDIEL